MKQLSVYVENKVGSMAKVTGMLSNASISIKAVSVFDSPDFSILRCIVDEVEKAKEVLIDNKVAVRVTDVITICLEDRTGSLDELLHICSDNGINIRYMYSFVYRGISSPLLVISADEHEKAMEVLKQNHVNTMETL